MTRRSDLMCEDIFGCKHEPETAIVENGEILEWRCRCGQSMAPSVRPAQVIASQSDDRDVVLDPVRDALASTAKGDPRPLSDEMRAARERGLAAIVARNFAAPDEVAAVAARMPDEEEP